MTELARMIALLTLLAIPAGVAAQTAPPAFPPPAPSAPPATAPPDAPDLSTAGQPAAPPLPGPFTVPVDAAAPLESRRSVDPGTLPRDLSPWGMFLSADRVVKAVMIGLAFASVVTWTVWLVKTLEIAGARLATGAALRRLGHVRSLDEASSAFARHKGPAASLVGATVQETELSADLLAAGCIDGIKERIEARLVRIESATGRRLARGTGILASIGATAPFVGLFGTVWGIMNSFIGISEAETTNLAVVAPGIAEALLATAFGLVAAIPAVVIYNLFARSIGAYRARLADVAAMVMALASRDLDRGFLPRSVVPPATARAAAE